MFKSASKAASQYAIAYALSTIAARQFEDAKFSKYLLIVNERQERYAKSGGKYKIHPPLRRMAQHLRRASIKSDQQAFALFPDKEAGIAALAAMQDYVNGRHATVTPLSPTFPISLMTQLGGPARLRIARAALA